MATPTQKMQNDINANFFTNSIIVKSEEQFESGALEDCPNLK